MTLNFLNEAEKVYVAYPKLDTQGMGGLRALA